MVSCKRKVLRSNYYASKSNHLKQIAGIALAPGSDSLFANLQIEGSTILPEHWKISNQINSALLQPMESFQSLEPLPSHNEDLSPLTLLEPAFFPL